MAGTPGRRAPYKDTLQPALHRRFSSTATLLLAVSYLEAVLLATWSSYFWSWFPLGPAGIRTAFIFACGLAILILRIAHYHVGLQTTASGLHTLGAALLSLQTYETGFWYGVSSLFFCPVFLSCMPKTSNLQWITYFSGDRARLNERPIFLACYLGACALSQTIWHYRLDVDRLDLGLPKPTTDDRDKESGVLSGSLHTALMQLPGVFAACVKQAISALFMALILYYLFLRSFAWGWALTFLRPFYSLPKTSMLPPSWPTDVFILARCIHAGILLTFLWSVGNTAFSIFMVREPLKNGKPLTSESKDPNGSLLNGLKSKKLSIKSFAMWELALISKDFEARRQAIYSDIDRKDGPVWSQIYTICMELLKSVELRTDDHGKPTTSAAVEPAAAVPRQRISAPLREDPILSQRAQNSGLLGGMEKAWDQLARDPGTSPVSELSPLAKKTWKGAKDRMLSKEQQEALSPDHIKSEFEQWAAKLVKIEWVGSLLRQDFRTRLAAAVLGTPYAEPTLYVHAVQALCQLAVHSLAEDEFGNVHRDVASIVRTLTAVIRKVEALKARFPSHWTDQSGPRESPEVDGLLDALRTGLDQVVCTFEPYSSDLRLSRGDLRLAKEAAVKPKEVAPAEPAPMVKEAASKRKSVEERRKSETRRVHGKAQPRVEMEHVR
ncbi:hypothetical protein G6O67_005780 [Ophiocordyceps sinensis]|uniref:Nuclear envelope protein n=1 Tax=Ophiocordyceps sinensis TaxID=72228 RepID=A0A8H4LXL8_9HYPO|nr:hypothetical protein G6O67_005780 [Ophiocordyceps sinensis]